MCAQKSISYICQFYFKQSKLPKFPEKGEYINELWSIFTGYKKEMNYIYYGDAFPKLLCCMKEARQKYITNSIISSV